MLIAESHNVYQPKQEKIFCLNTSWRHSLQETTCGGKDELPTVDTAADDQILFQAGNESKTTT